MPRKLSELREEAGITQARAAKLCHSNLSAWRGWESGSEPMPPSLYRLFFEELSDAYRIASRP
jgi:transcriptional regulator with XRE-family HTH domain